MTADLKRLHWVQELGAKGLVTAAALYAKGKETLPGPVVTRVVAVEQRASELASPLVTAATDASGRVLTNIDNRVDGAVELAVKLYEQSSKELHDQVAKQKAFHDRNVAHYKAAREAYLKRIEEAVDFLKAEGVAGAARAAADAVSARVADAKKAGGSAAASIQGAASSAASSALDRVTDAWSALVAQPTVQKVLASTPVAGAVATAKAAAEAAAAALTSSPTYGKAVATGGATLAAVQASGLYQKAAARLYPAVAPIADPAVAALTPYLQTAAAALKPVPAA